MKKRTVIFSLIILYLSAGVIFAEAVGKLTLEKGILKLRRNAVDTVYREQGTVVEVQNGDEIQTAANSLAKIRLSQNGDDIDIFSNSLFVVSNVDLETSDVSMPVGKSRFLIKPRRIVKKNRKRFRLKTTNAVIGVKGTDFIVGVHDGNTSLLTLEGVVSLSSISEPEVEVEVKLNQASQIKQDQRPTVPIFVSPQAREAIISADTPAAFKSAVFGGEAVSARTDTDKKREGKSETEAPPKQELATDAPLVDQAENENPDIPQVELDEVLDEVAEIVEEVVEEADTGPSEVEIIIDIVE